MINYDEPLDIPQELEIIERLFLEIYTSGPQDLYRKTKMQTTLGWVLYFKILQVIWASSIYFGVARVT